ncbi:MAG: hypothetical protein R2856_11970 [Caldilineaceae bacterium]
MLALLAPIVALIPTYANPNLTVPTVGGIPAPELWASRRLRLGRGDRG